MKPSATAATSTVLEAQILGAVLAGGAEALLDLPAGFTSAAIQNRDLRRALEAVQRLADRKAINGGPVDHDLVIAEAGFTDAQRETLATCGEWTRVDSRTLREYASALLDKHRRSELLNALSQASSALADGEEPTSDIASKLATRLLDLDTSERPETISYQDAILSAIEAVDKVKSGAAKVLRTGIDGLDRILRIRPGNLVVLAARPKVGKSTLARQISRAVALRRQHVAWHGLEMDSPETVALDLSAGASIDSMKFFDQDDPFTERDWAAIQATAERLIPQGTAGFIHSNHYHHSLGAICRISEKLHKKHTLSLIVVDYLQLVQCDLGRGASRENVVSTISRTLKLMAQRLGVPVLAMSQLNRESEKRGEQKAKPKARPRVDPMSVDKNAQPEPTPRTPPPKLHDLRESGAIEQDANAVVFLHHPLSESGINWERDHGPFELIVAAQRLGPTGSVSLHAERQFSRFKEIEWRP